jgi:hypothetical protein
MAEGCSWMDQRDDEAWELAEALRGEEYFEAERALGNAARKKALERIITPETRKNSVTAQDLARLKFGWC